MLLKQPYFMENPDWYYFVPNNDGVGIAGKYHLTELGKSIPEVAQSYKEYYDKLNNQPDDLGFMYDTLKEIERDIIEEGKQQGKTQEEIDAEIYELWHPKQSNEKLSAEMKSEMQAIINQITQTDNDN